MEYAKMTGLGNMVLGTGLSSVDNTRDCEGEGEPGWWIEETMERCVEEAWERLVRRWRRRLTTVDLVASDCTPFSA